MSLKVAVQMDPLETINIAGDSTFAIMLGAQARGHRLFHYNAGDLSYRDGRVTAPARPVTVQRVAGDHFSAGDPVVLDLAEDVDVVLMRQDPPFDLAYITATHLLERIRHRTLVVNDPESVRNAPEKLFVLDYAEFMPPTLITRRLEDARAFHAEHGEVVVKPLYGNAGSAVFHVGRNDANLAALTELFGQVWREPFMVQAFLPDVAKGDKRIVLVDGKPTGAINRLPKDGEIRSNLAAGGRADATDLTAREQEICAAIGPELARRGLLFVGIDVIAGHLTEINVTSPTGIVAIDRFNGTDTPAVIWDAIEAKLAARGVTRG
ncbi:MULTISPECIES: glutathione synthase [Sphingomonadales]|uniref:Glutathione synthetase n=1 Tax=Edaphosphingomonas haloaromaticamans TaxID=653954 RepID=A0A1S1HES3_9SPHN|nr:MULTISPECIES: glutathione synthase [Sphingomonas]AGH48232.1 glutathione synthetase [Sphingomonas sp. MM-1]OHT20705.1 Glutathione synthetase [Sphingomonas haloaromaticamans]